MCTNISILRKSKTDAVISARTLDFGKVLPTTVNFVPRGQSFPGMVSPEGIRWKNKYGFIGMGLTLYGLPILTYLDGLNEAGLSAAALWMPGSIYPKPKPYVPTLFNIDLVSYVLGNFQNVDEVKAALSKVTVIEAVESHTSGEPPLHFIVSDAYGSHLVVEFMNGEMQTYKNKMGVLTNAPSFDWHLTNLSSYENLSLANNPEIWWGQEINGGGQLGSPGDPTPPSRFIRAALLSKSTFRPENTQQGVGLALQILQTLAVPHGTVLDSSAKAEADYTQWGVIRDHTCHSLYFYTDFNSKLYGIHLDNLNFNAAKQQRIWVVQPIWYVDITERLEVN